MGRHSPSPPPLPRSPLGNVESSADAPPVQANEVIDLTRLQTLFDESEQENVSRATADAQPEVCRAMAHTQNLQVARKCLTYLKNVALIKQNTTRVLQDGGVEAALQVCTRFPHDNECQFLAAWLFKVLSIADGIEVQLMMKGATGFCVDVINNLDRYRDMGDRFQRICHLSMSCLLNCSVAAPNRVPLLREGTVEVCCKILRDASVDNEITEIALRLAKSISVADGIELDMVNRGVIGALAAFLARGTDNEKQVTLATTTVVNILCNSSTRLPVLQSGGCELAASVITQYRDNLELVQHACRILKVMSIADGGEQTLIDRGGAAAIMQAMHAHPADKKVADAGSVMINNIGVARPCAPALLAAGACVALGAVAEHFYSDAEMGRDTLKAFKTLSAVPDGEIQVKCPMHPLFHQTNQYIAPVALILLTVWVVEIANLVVGHSLYTHGIQPRAKRGLIGIVCAPFIHTSLGHTVSNSLPLLVLGGLVLAADRKRFIPLTACIILSTGVLVWLFARTAYHVGASGLVFGYLGALVVNAWTSRSVKGVAIAAVSLFLYKGLIWGVLPTHGYLSWESHLFGLSAGACTVWYIDTRGGARKTEGKREREREVYSPQDQDSNYYTRMGYEW
ncbi:peptidase S54, rhomboid [Kipferlia bialata]|uniref:Peptidase S54, rhomboid n=1 Tax=Kipferlia bialata TaxID=797122 RepID=A0A9K3GGV1_9EUKA|nr:peptidase S54, rhomboid [Kipferlia bialata]|eukprot:g4875.t1